MNWKFAVFSLLISANVNAGCLDDVSSTTTIYSKIKGFYIGKDNADSSLHTVILDKKNCSALASGDTELASSTKNHYYLIFRAQDQTLFATLLSAQARDIEVEFRIAAPYSNANANTIAYVISPAKARSQ